MLTITLPDPQLIAALIGATTITTVAALAWWFNSDKRQEYQAIEAAHSFRKGGR